MDATLHGVKKIKFGEIERLGSGDNTHTRKIFIETEDGEKLEITCFGEGKEKLQIEVEPKTKI